MTKFAIVEFTNERSVNFVPETWIETRVSVSVIFLYILAVKTISFTLKKFQALIIFFS
jgi:hypothetical protein